MQNVEPAEFIERLNDRLKHHPDYQSGEVVAYPIGAVGNAIRGVTWQVPFGQERMCAQVLAEVAQAVSVLPPPPAEPGMSTGRAEDVTRAILNSFRDRSIGPGNTLPVRTIWLDASRAQIRSGEFLEGLAMLKDSGHVDLHPDAAAPTSVELTNLGYRQAQGHI